MANRSRNPETGRQITIGGPTYKRFEKLCYKRVTGGWNSVPTQRMAIEKPIRRYNSDIPGSLHQKSRGEIAVIVNKELTKIDNSQWDMCMTGRRSKFRDSLNHVVPIGKGTFGEIYLARRNGLSFVVKEAYLSQREKENMLAYNGRKPVGDLPKRTYPEEWRILRLIQSLLRSHKSQNFIYTYGLSLCAGCQMSNEKETRNSGYCYLTFMEPANGDFNKLLKEQPLTVDFQWSFYCQLLIALCHIHSLGIFHRDIKLANLLYKRIRPGGWFEYRIGEDVFYVQNVGILALLSDFGVSTVLKPSFGDILFGSRNAKVVLKQGVKVFKPIKCEYSTVIVGKTAYKAHAKEITWTNMDGTFVSGTVNNFIKGVDLKPDIPVNLNNTRQFPPFEWFHDIQDVVRVFIGGPHVIQKFTHPRMPNLDPNFYRVLAENCYIDSFPWKIDGVKYILAEQMLKSVYNQIDRPTVIETFSLI